MSVERLFFSNCFYNAQFGFCLSLSTNNVLMPIIENIQSQLDQNKFCTGVFVDLKKAFDMVDHEIFQDLNLIMVLGE